MDSYIKPRKTFSNIDDTEVDVDIEIGTDFDDDVYVNDVANSSDDQNDLNIVKNVTEEKTEKKISLTHIFLFFLVVFFTFLQHAQSIISSTSSSKLDILNYELEYLFDVNVVR